MHRYEPSGALHGLLRVRHFTQDDAHIFCTEEQITEECVQAERAAAVDLSRFRLRGCAHQILRPAGEAGRLRRRVGQGGGGAQARGGGGGAPIRAQPGRGRVLRAEARICAARRDRPATGNAARSRSTSICRSGSAPIYIGPERGEDRAGDDPPRHVRLARALHRHPHRALCRAFAAVAGAGAGDGRHHRLRCRRLCGGGACGAASGGLARRGRSPQREDQLQSARALARQGAGAARGRQARGRGEDGVDAPARQSRSRR